MINGLGVLGWGVGGIEAEAVMLGQAISMLLPKVVGYRLHGKLGPYITSTDLVLTITKVIFIFTYFLISTFSLNLFLISLCFWYLPYIIFISSYLVLICFFNKAFTSTWCRRQIRRILWTWCKCLIHCWPSDHSQHVPGIWSHCGFLPSG